jgi:hypothetical protein
MALLPLLKVKYLSWRDTVRAKSKKAAEHKKALAPFRDSSYLAPLMSHRLNWIRIQLYLWVTALFIIVTVSMFGGVIISNPNWFIELIALQLARVAKGTVSFGSIYGSFSMAVIALTCLTVQVFLVIRDYFPSISIQTIYDTQVDLDERTQTRLAEVSLSLDEQKKGARNETH